jgi:mannose-6-phosphate isomerase-like protein (cupin superfamily)
MSVDLETRPDPSVVVPGAGEAWWWFGQLATVKAGAAETHGRYTLVEIVAPPDYETPLHRHGREDEAFWILEGDTRFYVGDEIVDASPGTYLVAPRGVAHGWRAGSSGARVLFLFTPGGFERFIAASGLAARELTVPPPDVVPPENAGDIAREFGGELLGELPADPRPIGAR